MSTYPGFSIQLERNDRLAAEASTSSLGGQWLRLTVMPDNGGTMSVFIPGNGRAGRIADAINEAWPDPAPEASRVITHPRPSYHRQAEGLRAENVLEECRCINPWRDPTDNCTRCGGHIPRVVRAVNDDCDACRTGA